MFDFHESPFRSPRNGNFLRFIMVLTEIQDMIDTTHLPTVQILTQIRQVIDSIRLDLDARIKLKEYDIRLGRWADELRGQLIKIQKSELNDESAQELLTRLQNISQQMNTSSYDSKIEYVWFRIRRFVKIVFRRPA